MKNKQLSVLALMLGMIMSAVSFTACDKDDDKGDPPTIAAFAVANDNKTATVVFSEAVYKSDNQTGNLDKAAFSVTIAGGTATLADFTVTHTAGTNEVVLTLDINGVANGSEVVTVKPSGANAIFNAKGGCHGCSTEQDCKSERYRNHRQMAVIRCQPGSVACCFRR